MKFYSYANRNRDYRKAIRIDDAQSVVWDKGTGKSQIRWSVCIWFKDNKHEEFDGLFEDESIKLYNDILMVLNKE